MEIALEYPLENLETTAELLLNHIHCPRIMLFIGEMGTGKTTLIKTICKKMGVFETVSSPTFSLVNEYESSIYGTVYHFDLYRLKEEAEADAIGFSEYLHSGYPCIIEWPEKAPKILTDLPATVFRLEHLNENLRKISLTELK